MFAENRGDGLDSFLDPFLQQGEEDLFLASVNGIEGAARVAGSGSDVFQACGFEAVTRKNALRGGQQFSPCRFGSLDLPRADSRAPRNAVSALAYVLGRQ